MIRAAALAGSVALAALAVSAPATSARAQNWRTIQSARQLSGNGPVSVKVQFGAGVADILPAEDRWLYRMDLRYDAERTAPVMTFDESARELRLGARSAGGAPWKGRRGDPNRLRVELTRRVPLRLTVDLGAARADLQLGGLELRELDLRAGATEASVDMAEPNPAALDRLRIDVGAGALTVRHGGNLRAQDAAIHVGAGSLDYDFGGDWSGDMDVELDVALGKATLRIPEGAGISLTANTILGDFTRAGLVRRGDAWISPGFDQAARHVRVMARATLGSIEIVRR